MGQLEDLQRNRLTRSQNLQKGFSVGDDNQDDIVKAHQDGDIHPNGKWVWVSSANGGKGDWRVIKKNAQSPAQKTSVSQESDTKELEKHIDGSDYSNLEKQFAKHIVAGHTEQAIRSAAKKAGVDDGVVEYSYKKAEKLVSEAKQAQAKSKKSASAQDANKSAVEKKIIDLLAVSNSKYKDISKVTVDKTPNGNWHFNYDGHDVFTVDKSQFTEKQLKDAGVLVSEEPEEKTAKKQAAVKDKIVRGVHKYLSTVPCDVRVDFYGSYTNVEITPTNTDAGAFTLRVDENTAEYDFPSFTGSTKNTLTQNRLQEYIKFMNDVTKDGVISNLVGTIREASKQ